jgi:PAS domain S-box-containing protein
MTNLNKSKEELSIELQELKQELSLLKTSYEKDIAKARQNEIKLQISEAQKKAILNGISANIAFVDKDLKIIWANKTAAQSVNKNPDEMVGHNCHHFWGDPKNPCENCPSLKAFESKKSEQIIINTPNGKIWEEKGEPIFDEAGNLIGVVEIATDITERKQVENENGKIQKLLEDSQRIGKIGGWEFNIDTLELKWTKEMYNIHEVDLNFKPNVDQRNNFYTPESIPVVNNAVHRAIEFGEPYEIDSEIITAKGNRRSVKSIGKPDLENRRIFGLFQDITDRKRTEKALQESEEKYRILVENSLVGVVQTKLNGEVLYVNDAFVKMYEAASAEEFIGKNMTGVYKYNRDRDEVLRLLKKDGRVDNFEVVGLTTKGNEKTRLLSAKISGEVINGLVFDITERKNAEEALRKSEQMLRETGRIAKLGGWEIDLATENLKWSDETYRIHEVDPHSQPLIEDGISFYAPEAQPILKEAVEHAIKGGVPFDLELPFITAKGKSLWVRSIGKTEHVDGQTIRLYGVFQDITERKLAEDALLKSEQKLETMLQTMVEGMVTIDLTGEITYCNKAAKQILGMDKTVLG